MRIFIYDNNHDDLSKIHNMLKSLPLDLLIDTINNYENGIEFYDKFQYDIVLIDFTDDLGRKILSFILDKNPKQRVVTISDQDICSEKDGCESCVQKYNKQRVLKPINTNDLIKIITNGRKCSSYCSNNLLIKLEKIAKDITFLTFDRDNLIFLRKDKNSHKETTEIINMTYALADKNIHFQVLEHGLQIIKDNNELGLLLKDFL